MAPGSLDEGGGSMFPLALPKPNLSNRKPALMSLSIALEEEEEEEEGGGEEEEEEEEEELLLIYTAQGSPFRCEKLPAINESPEDNNVQKLHYTYNHYTNTVNNINRKLCTN